MYRRFNRRSIPNIRVLARFGDKVQTVVTNDAGFFEIRFDIDSLLTLDSTWCEIHLELPDFHADAGWSAIGRFMSPLATAQFGIVSDLDDTVLQSDVVNLLKLARNTFLHNSHTRLPFAGVAEFYTALQRGTHNGFNPIFYVSNSPWNIYDVLVQFFEVRGIPLGPLFLSDLGLSPKRLIRHDPARHELLAIEHLLHIYPEIPFLLIGDSGEHDPEIYLKAIQNHPGRIKSVYIRDVTSSSRHRKIKMIVEQTRALGVEMLLVPNTVVAAEHAAAQGYILAEALPSIQQERHEDEALASE